MSLKAFTKKQKKILENNPNIKNVGDRAITYTKEFKIHFLSEKKNGKNAFEIFEEAGFDTKMIGSNRVTTFDVRVTRDGVIDRRKGHSGRPKGSKKKVKND